MSESEPDAPTGRLLRRGLLIVGVFFALGCCFGTGLITGMLAESRRSSHQQYLRERDLIAPILARNTAYSRVEIREYSAGGIYLIGDVPTNADRERLREEVTRAVGETRANEILVGVDVKK